jgi:dolichol-phosphate mannosyltransferase
MLSIILPVKEPEPYVPTLLVELERYVSEPYEVLIQKEKGLGYAVMQGVKKAKGNIIVVLDADGSHPVSAIPCLVALMGKYDLVVASRYCGGATCDSLSRELVSRVYCLLAQLMFGLKIKDNMSGFVVAWKHLFMVYPIRNDGFKWGLEMLVRSKSVYDATEFPIVFEKRKAGKSKASPMEAIHTFMFMLKLRVQIKGKF